ncbi:MAG TPA: hypothetical protein VFB46_10590 [Gemmatimonadaceae bacterium]|nr:hypothetical protein [Gemmatimonadaceae bacterium]
MRTGESSVIAAVEDAALRAEIVRRRPMRYAGGADPRHDRPAHVRAASGVVWAGPHLAVIQDDASFLALVDSETGLAHSVPLPASPGGARQFDDTRGNKAKKLDLEALTAVPNANGTLLAAFGSGSLAPREIVVLIALADDAPRDVTVRPAAALYAQLRNAAAFSGTELNIEGAVFVSDAIRVFGRGNGARMGDVVPVNASCDLPWPELARYLENPAAVAPPAPRAITQYALGTLNGVPLGFTDAARGCGDSVLYAAAAEASPDATRDGAISGSVIGVIEPGGLTARWTALLDETGRPFTGKVEGVALDPRERGRILAVVDSDDHARASDLLEIAIGGPWWGERE